MRWHGARLAAALLAAGALCAPAAMAEDDLMAGLDAVQSDGLGAVYGGIEEGSEQTVGRTFDAIEVIAEKKREELGDGYDPLMSALERAEWSLMYGLSRLQDGIGQAGAAQHGGGGLPQGSLASSVNPIPALTSGF